MGNPFLWWLATAALLVLIGILAERAWHWLKGDSSQAIALPISTAYDWTALYLVVNWLANWLPWAKVTRCVFIYHYMESLIFSFLAIALLVSGWLDTPDRSRRTLGITIVFAIALAFVFWLPMYLGLPITPQGLMMRQWLPSWI